MLTYVSLTPGNARRGLCFCSKRFRIVSRVSSNARRRRSSAAFAQSAAPAFSTFFSRCFFLSYFSLHFILPDFTMYVLRAQNAAFSCLKRLVQKPCLAQRQYKGLRYFNHYTFPFPFCRIARTFLGFSFLNQILSFSFFGFPEKIQRRKE